MTDMIELIAVPKINDDGCRADLSVLEQAVIDHPALELLRTNSVFVSFMGPQDALNDIKGQFGDTHLFEENQKIQLEIPGPFGSQTLPQPHHSTDGPSPNGSDTDDDDIVEL